MLHIPMWVVALLPLVAVSAPDYATLRGQAEPVSNLGRWLEKVVGDCDHDDAGFDKKGCEEEAARVRKRYEGQPVLIELDSAEEQVHFAEWDASHNAYRLHLTPFFGERALAMTVGKPEKTNKDGLPLMKNIPIWVKMPKGESELVFKRMLERSQVRVEMVVRPRKPWRLKRKSGEGDFRGLDVALLGLRVYPIQGQNVLAEQTY